MKRVNLTTVPQLLLFLADCTNGHDYDIICHLSVCNVLSMAKCYIIRGCWQRDKAIASF